MIYYGDEAGMWGANDPCCRKPMVWPEFAYEAEVTGPDGGRHEPDEVGYDGELSAWYRKLIALRRGSRALREGCFSTVLCWDVEQVYVFAREYGRERVVVVINNGEKMVKLRTEEVGIADLGVSALTGERIERVWVVPPVSGDVGVCEVLA